METTSNTQPCLTVNVEQAAELLGVSTDTVRRLIEDGELPAFRCGRGKTKGKILIRRQAVYDWVAKRETVGVL